MITAISNTVQEVEKQEEGDNINDHDDAFDKLINMASKAITESFTAAGCNVEDIIAIDEIAFAGSDPTLPLESIFSKEIAHHEIVSRSIFSATNHEGFANLLETRTTQNFKLLGVILLVLYVNRCCDDIKITYDCGVMEAESFARLNLLRAYQPHFSTDSDSKMVTFTKKPAQNKSHQFEYNGGENDNSSQNSIEQSTDAMHDDEHPKINKREPATNKSKTTR
jgi:hypothetical protein